MHRSAAVGLTYLVTTVACSMLGATTAGALAPAEICDNCFDDDGDLAVDRSDSDSLCVPPADGALAGLADATARKAAVKCQKTIGKAGAKFFAARVARIEKCVNPVFACIQLKNGDPQCIDKATRNCEKLTSLVALDKDETKLRSAMDKACRDTSGAKIALVDVLADAGLGYEAEQGGAPACAATFANFGVLATCIVDRHDCSAGRAVTAAIPRAHELLTAVFAENAFPCIGNASGSDGAGAGLAPTAKAKASVKCQLAIEKSGLKLATLSLKTGQKCLDAAATCIQSPDTLTRDACQQKVSPKCQASIVSLGGPLTKLQAATAKKCTSPDLAEADLEAPAGLAFASAAPRCAELNVTPLTDLSAILTCVGVQHTCEDFQMLERQVPRLRELADFLNIVIPDAP